MIWPYVDNTKPLSDYYFVVPKKCLYIMGFWPMNHCRRRSASMKWIHLLWPLLNFLILFIGVSAELHAGFALIGGNLEKALETLCPAGTSAVTLLKMFLISYYRNELGEILQRMQAMLYGEEFQLSAAKKRIIRNHFDVAFRLNFGAFFMSFITCTAYNMKPIFLALYSWWLGGQPFAIQETPFNMTLPSSLLHYPLFPVTYLINAYTGYITIYAFSGCDAFYFDFCSYLAALLRMLELDFYNLFAEHEDKFILSASDADDFERRLVALIKRHQDIIALKESFRQRYAVITLAHFVSASLVIGISIYDLLTFSGFGAIIYVTYTFAALSQLFMYCYGGTLVAENSHRIADVFGKCHWEVCSPRLRRMILIILIRSQRQLTMAVPFFVPSVATFTSILQTSASIIALASSMESGAKI